MAQKKSKKRKEKKVVPAGRAYVSSTFNNTIISMTDPVGNVISWGSSGTAGFKGSRKGTPYAAQLAARDAARRAMDNGMRQIDIFVKGPGSGREAAIRRSAHYQYPGRDPGAACRMPSAQEKASVRIE